MNVNRVCLLAMMILRYNKESVYVFQFLCIYSVIVKVIKTLIFLGLQNEYKQSDTSSHHILKSSQLSLILTPKVTNEKQCQVTCLTTSMFMFCVYKHSLTSWVIFNYHPDLYRTSCDRFVNYNEWSQIRDQQDLIT